jgi:chloramphenicol 3-O-phosphotransferase
MKDILLIGGMATGKTTLAKAIQTTAPNANYIYMAELAVGLPMTLQATVMPNILSKTRGEYIATMRDYNETPCRIFPRAQADAFGQQVMDTYGATIFAEIGYDARKPNKVNILDNIPKVANVQHLKDRGVLVVGLRCSFDQQVKRRTEQRKPNDPIASDDIARQIRSTSQYFELPDILQLADVVFDTTNVMSNSNGIVEAVLAAMKYWQIP